MILNMHCRRRMASVMHPAAARATGAAAAALVAIAAPAQAQVVCTTTGLDQSCVNTGTSGAALRAETSNGGNASGNNSGTIFGTTIDNVGRVDSILVFTRFGGTATAINSGGLGAGYAVTTENLTPGPNGDATGTNTASGTVATFFQVEAGFQSSGTGGTATGINAGGVGQFFQVDTLTGGNASGTNSGSVGQFFQVSTATGGNATGTNSGTVTQNFLVNAAAGGNVSGTNSGSIGTSFVVNTGVGLLGNASGTNTGTGTVGTDFQVMTGSGDVSAINAGQVGGNFAVTEQAGSGLHTVTAANSGSVGGTAAIRNNSGGDTSFTNTGSLASTVAVTTAGGNISATNTGSIGQSFSVSNLGNGTPSTVTTQNSGTIGNFFLTLNALGNATATNSGTVASVFQITAATGNANVTGTNTGTVGSVRLTASGGTTTFTNSGTITAAPATTAIQFNGGANNTLTLLQGSSIAGNIVGAGGGDTLNFALGPGTFTYNAASGFSGFNQVNVNSGTVILDGTNSATNFAVNGGRLEVDGAIAGATNVTVNGGGTLSGVGVIDPTTTTIMSGGTLAPGNAASPTGTLTIVGNLAFQPGAIYLVQGTPTSAASTSVSGTASLAGTVQGAGNFAKRSYDILHAAGGLGGTTFNGVSLGPNFAANLTYNATDVFLNLTSATLGAGTQLNQNQQHVANAIDAAFNAGAMLPANIGNLFTQTGSRLAGSLTQADGEAATGAERAVFQLTGAFLNLMLDPFVNDRHNPGSGGPALGFASDGQSGLPPELALAYGSVIGKAPPKPTFEQRWTAWGSAFGGANIASGNAAVGSTDITASTFGFAGGMDYHFTPDTIAGFALAGAGTDWGLANSLGTGRSDAFQAGGYGMHWFGPGYVAGAVAFSNHWFTTNRFALGDQLTAKFAGQSYGGRIEGGYRYAVLPAFSVTPYAALQAQSFHTPGYSETDLTGGGLGLAFAGMNATDVRSELGARFDAPSLLYGKPLLLFGRLAWAHDFVSNPALSAAFEGLPVATFTVNGAAIPHDAALTTAGAELVVAPNWMLRAKFEGEFASGSQTYAGTGTLRYTW